MPTDRRGSSPEETEAITNTNILKLVTIGFSDLTCKSILLRNGYNILIHQMFYHGFSAADVGLSWSVK